MLELFPQSHMRKLLEVDINHAVKGAILKVAILMFNERRA